MWLVFLFFPADFLTEAQNSYLSRLLSGEFGKVFLTPRLWYLVVSNWVPRDGKNKSEGPHYFVSHVHRP